MPNSKNVTGAKPKVAGAIYRAPLGTVLPTDATTTLTAEYKDLGYVSDEGITQSESKDSSNVVAFGGDVVYITEGEHTDTFQFVLLEFLNSDVLKMRYGEDNVTGTLDEGVTIQVNSKTKESAIYVIDLLLDGAVQRIVIPIGKITEYEDRSINNEDVQSVGVTITALPDTTGNKHYEYIKKA